MSYLCVCFCYFFLLMSRCYLYIRSISPLSMIWIANMLTQSSVYFLFYFEITWIHMHSSERIQNSCIYFTQFSPMVPSFKTIVQPHHQEIEIDAIYWHYSDFTCFTFTYCVCVCAFMYLIPCRFWCVDSCDHYHSQGAKQLDHSDIPCYPSTALATSPPLPSVTSSNY